MSLLQARNINKSYNKLQVLKGVDLDIEKGEFISIIGKSGAGKSTLLQILGTLDNPDEGTLTINGSEMTQLSPTQLAHFRNQTLGFVFQFHHLLPEFTALENVCLPAFLHNKDTNAVKKHANELLDRLGLSDRKLHKPSQMSGGEQQRVAIARSLINQPAIIFADEPTGNLDSQTSEQFHNLMLELKTELNTTFIVVTHNPELSKLSDRTLVMEDGLMVSN